MGNGNSGWFARSYQGIIIALLAILAVVLVVLAMQHVSAARVSADAVAGPIPTFSSAPIASKKQPAAALTLLDQKDRPFTISVIGDSTGAIDDNWVGQTAQWMSDKYDRPVELHQWSVRVEPNAYQPVQTIGTGANAPIVIWNGSAEGKDVTYSLTNWDKLVPVDGGTFDLAFINHGHNIGVGKLVSDGNDLLDKMTDAMTSAAVVVIAQNPQADEGGTLGPAQETNVRAWMSSAKRQGYAVVDVLDVFLDQDDYSKLLLGAVHPNRDGFALWAQAVEKVLSE
jgi:hypothetical protein